MFTKKQNKTGTIRSSGMLLLTSILLLSIVLSACGQNDSATNTPTPSRQFRQEPFPLDLTFTGTPGSSMLDGWGWGSTPNAYEEHYSIAFEPEGGPNGEPAIHIQSTAPVDRDYNSGGIYRQLADIYNFTGHRVRLSADIKSEDILWRAGLWMTLYGFGGRTLAHDDMWMSPIVGTNDWQRYEIVLDYPAIGETKVEHVSYGFELAGPGQVWVSNVRMEAVGTDVPVTDFLTYEPEPLNLDFEMVENEQFPGWRFGGRDMPAYIIEADSKTVFNGAQSITIHSASPPPDAWAAVWQRIAVGSYQGQQVRLTAQMKTDSVNGEASLMLEYNGRNLFKSPRKIATSPVLTGTNDWTTVEVILDLAEGTETIRFLFSLSGAGQIWVDDVRLEAVGPSAWTPEQEKVENYLNEVLDIMESHSLRRDEVDWPALRAEVFAQAEGAVETADTYEALRLAVKLLGDGHSRFFSPEEAEVLSGRENQTPKASLVSEHFGYLWLPGYLGTDPLVGDQHATQIQAIIAEVDKAEPCGWIVDLRENPGGALFPVLAGVGPLLTEGEVGQFVNRYGQTSRWIYRDGQAGTKYEDFEEYIVTTVNTPYRPDFPERPIAILIGPNTGSSGEGIVIAFHGQPNTRFFGQPTAGVSTGNSDFDLSDGAVLVLTTTIMANRFGQQFGQEIEPDIFIEPETENGTDTTLAEAIAWLQDSPMCQNK
ncbi:MAG: S41 family peptidase [Anaerolineales bacterium]